MITVDHPSIVSTPDLNERVTFYTYCLTCNDPEDTVLLLSSTPSYSMAMFAAREHEKEFGSGHSLLVNYSQNEEQGKSIPEFAALENFL